MTGRLALCLVLLGGLTFSGSAFSSAPADKWHEKPVYIYICGCAMASGCQTFFEEPGNCPCGKPLFKKQVIREDPDYYYVTRDAHVGCKCQQGLSGHADCNCTRDLYALAKNSRQKAFQCIKKDCDSDETTGD